MKHGQGNLTHTDEVYERDWQNEERHVKGHYSKDINGMGQGINPNQCEYNGYWQSDKRNGEGRINCPDGLVYEGDWQDDKRHGKGNQTYANGRVYEGYWENDERHGKGRLISVKNIVTPQEYNNGKLQASR